MSGKYDDFDEKRLFDLKHHHGGYRLCPRCGSELRHRTIDGHERLVCSAAGCDFVYYHNPVPAAGIIVVEEGEVLLVKRAHPPRIGWWCIPAGFMEWHEHPSETAVRELAEETGLEIEIKSIFDVYSGEDDPRANAILVLYLGRVVGGSMRPDDDASEVKFFPLDKLPDKIAFVAHVRALEDYKRRFGP